MKKDTHIHYTDPPCVDRKSGKQGEIPGDSEGPDNRTSPCESLYFKEFRPVSSKGLSMYVLTSIYYITTSSTGPSVFA